MSEPSAPWSDTEAFRPHGESFDWGVGVLQMHVLADLLLAAACLSLPFLLLYITRRRRDLPVDRLTVWLAIFTLATGLTHLLDVWNIWHTQYWLEGTLKVIAALAALPTAFLLWKALPRLLALPSHRQLREANQSLERANRELEAFTASVSHDLRSPLTTIAGQAGLLELSLTTATDEQKRRLLRIQSSVKQMSELIDALLALSRISRHTLHREQVDISALAQEVIADLRQKDPSRTIDVVIEPHLLVHGDRRLLNDLATNLVGNAWKFTAKKQAARIELGQVERAQMMTLFVRDNGAGFDMNYAQKLFRPFQRLHAPGEFDGSGVGLATVARIVDRHGGRIWAEAKPGEGATFYFTLPTQPVTDAILVTAPAT